MDIKTVAERPRIELACVLFVLLASLLLHTWLPMRHPPLVVSDFLGVTSFAADIAAHGPFVQGWYWTLFSAGTSTILAIPMAFSSADDLLVASTATAVVVSLLPVVPLVVLRGVLPLWTRLLAAGLIMLLPATTVFAGVVAQDNWVLLPALALACLATKNAYGRGRGRPVAAAVLWCLSLYIRQEMLVALLPLAILAAWPFTGYPKARPLLVLASVSVVLMIGIAGQRYIASGDFSLNSRHGGAALLGSYIPGASFGWLPYDAYIERRAPELAGDKEALREQAGRFALEEIRARPGFHLVRRAGAVLETATTRDGTLQFWAFGADDTFGKSRGPAEREAAARIGALTSAPVLYSTLLLHVLFLVAVYVGLRSRDPAIIAIALAIALKVGIHFVVAVQARFFLVVFVFEALAISLAVYRVAGFGRDRFRGLPLVALAATAVLWVAVSNLGRLEAWIQQADQEWESGALRHYHVQVGGAVADCQLVGGRVLSSGATGYAFAVENPDPDPGESAELRCKLRQSGEGSIRLAIEVEDSYAPGDLPDRMIQVVEVNGITVRRHDISAEAWSGWWSHEIPLQTGKEEEVRVRVEGLRPDKGPGWGDAARTTIRFVPSSG
ncbi:hypothetical protein [Pseudoxanthomonas suwonensis]|uniref:Glycosyltransferase RgtA/B/C/D-like domain-containing protein n=1 Tax=Pseudoxanthomonas suwonensis TaxID=314722 RepID=A0A0E3Z1P7_9GAMM|nr:hypothetical protein [Pseudoxanthomonas suwonensis]AKC87223.1 hypothetical protein WQ53_11185 [Pseudoxanthomonas suwonensis]